MRVLVAGASGFVGRRLCAALEDAGHAVRAMTRRPESYEGAGEAVQADVQDTRSLAAAVRGCDAAYYLVRCASVAPTNTCTTRHPDTAGRVLGASQVE